MARQEITLTAFAQNQDGSIEVGYNWNGYVNSVTFPDESTMRAHNADILVEPTEAVRWLLYYLLALGNDLTSMPTQVGRKLVVDIAPAVQQNISLV